METRSGSCTATSPPARASTASSAPNGAGERSLTAAATYRQDRRDKKLPVPAVPCKTQKRGLEMPGDVALRAVDWSPTTTDRQDAVKAGPRGKLPRERVVVPRSGGRPRSRLPSSGSTVPTTPSRCSSAPPSPTSCRRTRSRWPTRCHTPPSSQTWWPSVSACAVRRLRTAQQTQLPHHHTGHTHVLWRAVDMRQSPACRTSSNSDHREAGTPSSPRPEHGQAQ